MGLSFSISIFVLLLLLSLAYFFNKQKKVSSIIGYRTKQSMSSQKNWQESQKLFYILALVFQGVVAIFNAFIQISLGINVAILVVYFLIISIIIETRLKGINNKQN